MILPVSILVVCFTTAGMAQRSPYAPKPVGTLSVLEQFNPPANPGDNNVPNRFGGVDESYQGPLKPAPGTIGDPYLTPHLPEWPREHQPFWYLNQQHILNHRGQQVPAQVQAPNAAPAAGNAAGNAAGTTGQRDPARTQQRW